MTQVERADNACVYPSQTFLLAVMNDLPCHTETYRDYMAFFVYFCRVTQEINGKRTVVK